MLTSHAIDLEKARDHLPESLHHHGSALNCPTNTRPPTWSNPANAQVCQCLGLEWDETIPQQFDNVPQALLTFFEISTTEAWTEVMYAAVDATVQDMQPIRDANIARVWFFMLFMLIGSYLVMNLFVGVIIDNFNKASDLDKPVVTGGRRDGLARIPHVLGIDRKILILRCFSSSV